MINFSEEAQAIFKKAELFESELKSLTELAFSLITSKNIELLGIEEEIISGTVMCKIYVMVPLSNIFDINWELAGLFACLDDMRSDVLMFEYNPTECFNERYI